jgi:hypothetical protein
MSLHRTTKSAGLDPRVATPVKVLREDVPVMFTRAAEDTPAAIQHAWAAFEAAVGLRGRRFFGAVYDDAREYWVCTQLKTEDDPQALGFEVGTLPGGTYRTFAPAWRASRQGSTRRLRLRLTS